MTASCDSAFSSDQSQSGLFYLQVHNNDHEDELLGRSRTNVVQKAVPSLVHVLLLLIGGVIGSILTIKLTPKSQSVSSPPYWAHLGSMRGMSSPAFDVVRSHPLVHQAHQHDGTANPYRGAPGEVSNSAWKILLHGYNLRVPTDELPSDQSPSIHLTDGSDDAWVSLGVYHHLHCLDSLRHQLGGQQCPSYDTNYDENGFSKHFDHCIDTLRQWLMCQPDLTLRSVYWRKDGRSVAANNTISHQCVNWEALQDWVAAHTIDQAVPLVHRPDGENFMEVRAPPPRCAKNQRQ